MNFGMLDGEWKSCLAGSRTRECAYLWFWWKSHVNEFLNLEFFLTDV